MKRKFIAILVTLAVLFSMSVPVFAAAPDSETFTEIEYFADGSYLKKELTIETSRISLFATTSTKSAEAKNTYYSKSNRKEWDFTLKGTFSYNGTTAKATKATTSYNIYVTGWKCTDKSGTVSGATAKGTGTFKYSALTKTTTLGLKCSAKGVISAV